MSKVFTYDKDRIYYIFDAYDKNMDEGYILELLENLPENQINIRKNRDENLLKCAIAKNHTNVVKKVLQYSNLDNINGYQKLISNSIYRNKKIAVMLLDHDSDIDNLYSESSQMIFEYTISENDFGFFDYFINHKKININAFDKNGKTALMKIIQFSEYQMWINKVDKYVSILLDNDNIDIHIKNNNDESIVTEALSTKYCKDFKLLRLINHPKFDINKKVCNNKTLLDLIIQDEKLTFECRNILNNILNHPNLDLSRCEHQTLFKLVKRCVKCDEDKW